MNLLLRYTIHTPEGSRMVDVHLLEIDKNGNVVAIRHGWKLAFAAGQWTRVEASPALLECQDCLNTDAVLEAERILRDGE